MDARRTYVKAQRRSTAGFEASLDPRPLKNQRILVYKGQVLGMAGFYYFL